MYGENHHEIPVLRSLRYLDFRKRSVSEVAITADRSILPFHTPASSSAFETTATRKTQRGERQISVFDVN